jgi:BlaI family penicillinase repressor
MPKLPKISEAEWEVMKVLWEEAPLTANVIVARLSGKSEWKPKTVKTLINRLLQKQALGFEKVERTYSYYPVISRDECLQAENRSFLERVHGGNLQGMLTSFIDSEELSVADLAELKEILNRKKG